ncbi:MAG: phosphate uptake regulator PhoU [Candidatus Thermoplasmatota archaeon]
MDARRVQRTGGSTFIVSLPKAWAEEVGLKQGDVLELNPQSDGSLMINKARGDVKDTQERAFFLDEDSESHLWRRLVAIYMAGHRRFRIQTREEIDPKVRQVLRELTRRAIGPEIIEEAERCVVIQDLADPTEFPLSKGVRRMATGARVMHAEAMRALRARDKELARQVGAMDDEVDRLYWLIMKQYNMILRDRRIAEKIGMGVAESFWYLLVARILERVADHAQRIAENVVLLDGHDVDGRLVSEIEEASADSVHALETAFAALGAGDVAQANGAIDMAERLVGRVRRLSKRVLDEDVEIAVPLSAILSSIERTGSYAGDIGEIAINHVMMGASSYADG